MVQGGRASFAISWLAVAAASQAGEYVARWTVAGLRSDNSTVAMTCRCVPALSPTAPFASMQPCRLSRAEVTVCDPPSNPQCQALAGATGGLQLCVLRPSPCAPLPRLRTATSLPPQAAALMSPIALAWQLMRAPPPLVRQTHCTCRTGGWWRCRRRRCRAVKVRTGVRWLVAGVATLWR